MRILIATPVLNGARFLDAAIASVRAQTHTDWRLLVLDAGSTDGSIEIAQAHAQADDRISVQVAPDTGMYDALARGFQSEAREGDLCGWLNADDLYTPWAFATAADFAQARNADWISGLPALWDEAGRLRAVVPLGVHPRGWIARGWRHDGFLGAIQQESVFFAAGLWMDLTEQERAVFTAQSLAGDFYLWTRFARRTRLHAVPSVLGGFRVHPENRSRRQAGLYAREAQALGAKTPPRAIARLIRRFSDGAGALGAARAFQREALRLHAGAGG